MGVKVEINPWSDDIDEDGLLTLEMPVNEISGTVKEMGRRIGGPMKVLWDEDIVEIQLHRISDWRGYHKGISGLSDLSSPSSSTDVSGDFDDKIETLRSLCRCDVGH